MPQQPGQSPVPASPGQYALSDATPVGTYQLSDAQPLAPTGQNMPGETFSEKIENAANFLRDVATGFGKGAVHTGIDLASMVAQSQTIPGLNPTTLPQPLIDAALNATAYTNTAQRLGGGLETVGELAAPGVEGVKAADAAIPQASRAIANFENVASVANKVPIDLSEPGNVALKIADMAQRGGGTQWGPPPVRQFIQWATNPAKPPMTYQDARVFASNISRLSSKDMASIPPAMQYEIANLRVALNKSVGMAAASVGKGPEYASAMSEYARAMKLRDTLNTALQGAARYAPYLAAGGAAGAIGSMFGKQIASLWGGD